VTSLWTGLPRYWESIPGGGKRLFSFPRHPDCLFGPHNFPEVQSGRVLRGKAANPLSSLYSSSQLKFTLLISLRCFFNIIPVMYRGPYYFKTPHLLPIPWTNWANGVASATSAAKSRGRCLQTGFLLHIIHVYDYEVHLYIRRGWTNYILNTATAYLRHGGVTCNRRLSHNSLENLWTVCQIWEYFLKFLT
jgi:hypothetical protein